MGKLPKALTDCSMVTVLSCYLRYILFIGRSHLFQPTQGEGVIERCEYPEEGSLGVVLEAAYYRDRIREVPKLTQFVSGRAGSAL